MDSRLVVLETSSVGFVGSFLETSPFGLVFAGTTTIRIRASRSFVMLTSAR
jgi:hypothetical protein